MTIPPQITIVLTGAYDDDAAPGHCNKGELPFHFSLLRWPTMLLPEMGGGGGASRCFAPSPPNPFCMPINGPRFFPLFPRRDRMTNHSRNAYITLLRQT